jgi:trimeric autotransporter adhesin
MRAFISLSMAVLCLIVACSSPTGGEAGGTDGADSYPLLVVVQGESEVDLETPFDFGSIQENTSRDLSFTVENRGSATLELTGSPPLELVDNQHQWFAIIEAPATSLAPGETTTFTLRFAPDGVGVQTANIAMGCNDPNHPTLTLPIQGEGTATPVPEMHLKQGGRNLSSGAEEVSYSDVLLGDSSSLGFTIQNLGDGTLHLTGSPRVSVQMQGSEPGQGVQFSVTSQPVASVAPGGSTTFDLEFAPLAEGAWSAEVSIANDDSDENPYTFLVSGSGVTPEMDIKTTGLRPVTIPDGTGSYNFGQQRVGSTRLVTFSVHNYGSANLSLSGSPRVVVGGTSRITVNTQAPSAIIPGGFGTFRLAFSPTGEGAYSGTVSIANNDLDENPYTFTVSGTGVASEISVFDFQDQPISDGDDGVYLGQSAYGSISRASEQVFTITNTGSASLNLNGDPRVSLSNIDGGLFSITEQPAAIIAPGGQTTFTLRFQATQTEMAYATVTIGNDDPNENPFTFGVEGDGQWWGLIIGSTDR